MKLALSLVAMATVAVVLIGCQESSGSNQEQTRPARPKLTMMPDLIGANLARSSEVLADTSLEVAVEFPGYDALWSEEATYIAGTQVPGHDETVTIETRVRAMRDVDQDDGHVVVSQEPAPGTSLSSITTATLVAGPHPNPTGMPWLTSGHKQRIREVKAHACFDCHSPDRECAKCHTEMTRD